MRRWTSVAACGLVLAVGAQLPVGTQLGVGTAAAATPRQDAEPTRVAGQSSANGATLLNAEDGWYRSKAPGADQTLHYQVERRLAGSHVTAGIITRTPEPLDGAWVKIELATVGGTVCDSDNTWLTLVSEPRDLMEASVSNAVARPDSGSDNGSENGTGSAGKTARECARADRFVLTVRQDWDGSDELRGTRMDVVVNEEPPVENSSELPKPGEPPPWVPPSSSGRVEVGGARHPLRAEALRPGSYRTTISSGEQLFFRVDLDWGQALQAHVRVPRPPQPARGPIDDGSGYQMLDGQLLSPTFGNPRVDDNDSDMDSTASNTAVLSATAPSELQVFTNRVRYQARTVAEPRYTRKASAAGPYYLVLTLSDSEQKYELPVELELSTRGGIEDPPEYAAGAVPIGPGLGGDGEATGTVGYWLLGGGVALFLLGVGTLTASSYRARATARPGR